MNNQLIDLIKEIASSREVTEDVVVASLEDAMKKAYEKEFPEEVAEVTIDKNTGKISLYKVFAVVEDATDEETINEYSQMKLKEALKMDKNASVGSTVKELIDIASLPRRVVSHILQVLKHDVSIESNKSIYSQWIDKKGSIIYAEVENVDARKRLVTVALDNEGKIFGVVSRAEQNPDEKLIPGSKYKFFVKDVLEQTKGWPIILSRADGAIVSDLLHVNIPEIQTGVVQVVKVGRVAGFKSKVSVKSTQPGIDPIGACIGARADRIKPILSEMGDERIEFVAYDEDLGKYLVNACNPAPLHGYKVIDAVYETDELGNKKEVQRKKIILIVPDDRLALIIGARGKNVRVLADLLDCNVEAMTIEEANESKLEYIRSDRIAPVVAATSQPTAVKKPANKYGAVYDKYHTSTSELLDSINENNDIVDTATANEAIVDAKIAAEEAANNKEPEPIVEEEPAVEISNEDLSSYADDLAALDELTGNGKKDK